MINYYPNVVDEMATVDVLLKGSSIGRLGDGEFKLIVGQGYVREPANPRLGRELAKFLKNPAPSCIVGLPRITSLGPKNGNWLARIPRYIPYLSPEVIYYSAFISRPDSAPWIDRPKFAHKMQQLWKDRKVVAVCEPKSSLRRMLDYGAGSVEHIECPSENAYALIDLFEKAVVQINPQIAFLACGPTATCLANRLALRGIQTIDMGSGGAFIARLLAA
jgi:hypothetical protein